MKRWALRSALLLVFMSCFSTINYAAGSKMLKWKGIHALSKATIENVMVDEKGFATLSYSLDTLFSSAEIFLWDCDFDSRGNMYIASGNAGKVFRISPNRQVFTVFTGEAGTEIFAVAVDEHDNVYVGESPSGTVYRLGKGDKQEEYFITDEHYIWDLAFDTGGTLFAATGDQGKIYRILGKSRGEVYYRSTENHIVTMLFHDGKLYAGTEPNGLFLQIVEKDEAIVHYDTDEQEVRAIAAYLDTIYFSTVSQPLSSAASSYTSFFGPAPMDMQSIEKSTLYRFHIPTGSVVPLWDCVTPPIYAIVTDEAGRVLIGAEGGKLFYLHGNRKVGFVNQLAEHPLLSLVTARKGDGIIILTGNLGNVIQMGPDLAKVGTIESHVIDTRSRSAFGRIDWNADVPAGTDLSVWIRAGNRENPDENWSSWKEMRKGAEIGLHPSRFIQIKCELRTASSGKTPLFKDVSISYLPENRMPAIFSLVVCPAGVNGSEAYDPFGGVKMPLGEKDRIYYVNLGYDLPQTIYMLEKGKRCAIWQAADPDGDSLTYTFYYRGVEERQWKELKKKLMVPAVIWDETAFPDGLYRVKLVASDKWNNPPERTRTTEMESEPFLVDNARPVVEVTSIRAQGNGIHITVSAEDALSILKEARYSVNAEEWQAVLPKDGIFDEAKEDFAITIDEMEPGEYTVVFKVVDFALNTGTGKGTTEIK